MKNGLWAVCLLAVSSCGGVGQRDTPASQEAPKAIAKPELMDITRMERAENILAYEVDEKLFLVTLDGKYFAGPLCRVENPKFSPDGRKIAFTSDEKNMGDIEIYIMDVNGTNPKRLTYNDAFEFAPAWSPDGQKIVFTLFSDFRSRLGEIYIMNADGSQQKRLTHGHMGIGSAVWSPDGSMLAFTSSRNGSDGIYIMNADGSNMKRLTHNKDEYLGRLSWSPDSQKITFYTLLYDTHEICVINADGSGQKMLTNKGEDNLLEDCSPVDAKIAFISGPDGDDQIFIMNADGSGQKQLTDKRHARAPIWSPDGAKIVFQTYFEGHTEVYIINADGSGLTLLARFEGHVPFSRSFSPMRRDGVLYDTYGHVIKE